jgi:hypothetical protein
MTSWGCTFFGDELKQKIGFLNTLNCAHAFNSFSFFTHKTRGIGVAPSFPTWRNINNGHQTIHGQILVIPTVKWTTDVIRLLYCHLATLSAKKIFILGFFFFFTFSVVWWKFPYFRNVARHHLIQIGVGTFETTWWSHLPVRTFV